MTYLAAPGVVDGVAEHNEEDLDADSPASGGATYTSSTTSGLFASYATAVARKPNPRSEVAEGRGGGARSALRHRGLRGRRDRRRCRASSQPRGRPAGAAVGAAAGCVAEGGRGRGGGDGVHPVALLLLGHTGRQPQEGGSEHQRLRARSAAGGQRGATGRGRRGGDRARRRTLSSIWIGERGREIRIGLLGFGLGG